MLTSRSLGHKVLAMWSSSSYSGVRIRGPSLLGWLAGSVVDMEPGPAAAANRHCLELYTRVYKSRHPSSLSSPLAHSAWVPPSPLTPPRPRPCAPCLLLLLRSLLSLSLSLSHLDPSFNRLCRICLAPLTFPQNPPAGQTAARTHSPTDMAQCSAVVVASP